MYVWPIFKFIAEYQPSKVANPARSQPNRGNHFFFTVPSSFSLLILHTQAESDISSRSFSYTANRHRVGLEFIKSRNCVPMAFIAERSPAQGQ